MEHGIDFDLALQDPETPLNISQRFVSADDFFRSVVRHVGDQKQFPIEHSDSVEGLLIMTPSKPPESRERRECVSQFRC
jgi:hypothetical protein